MLTTGGECTMHGMEGDIVDGVDHTLVFRVSHSVLSVTLERKVVAKRRSINRNNQSGVPRTRCLYLQRI